MFNRFISRLILLCTLPVVLMSAAACLPAVGGDAASEARRLAAPYALNVPAWELHNTFAPPDAAPQKGIPAALGADIENALAQQGIAALPPVRYRLVQPPLLLVISPRERIFYLNRLLLQPGMDAARMEELEDGIAEKGLSALVVKIGGFGAAYPAVVSPSLPLKTIAEAVVEEWAHQYLALRPLGFLYLLDSLGFSQDPGVITMNETLAGMMADEISAAVCSRYSGAALQQGGASDDGFDFAAEMRLTRRQVDELLAGGSVDEAERYMNERRDFFVAHGYPIRKLNQAYFAFHGIYGQDPGSASPVYGQMKKLRQASGSLAEFVQQVSAMTGSDALEKAVDSLPR
ncbi:MAG: hypothetical protein WC541_06845 [Dehalococcoidia bacterium]